MSRMMVYVCVYFVSAMCKYLLTLTPSLISNECVTEWWVYCMGTERMATPIMECISRRCRSHGSIVTVTFFYFTHCIYVYIIYLIINHRPNSCTPVLVSVVMVDISPISRVWYGGCFSLLYIVYKMDAFDICICSCLSHTRLTHPTPDHPFSSRGVVVYW